MNQLPSYLAYGALNITKLRNRLNKDTFNIIICLKSWGIIKEEEKEAKEDANKDISVKEASFIY